MALYEIKEEEIEAFTFSEIIGYGKLVGANVENGIPLSFKFRGHHLTHERVFESDIGGMVDSYIVHTCTGATFFTNNDILILTADGVLIVIPSKIFYKLFKRK